MAEPNQIGVDRGERADLVEDEGGEFPRVGDHGLVLQSRIESEYVQGRLRPHDAGEARLRLVPGHRVTVRRAASDRTLLPTGT